MVSTRSRLVEVQSTEKEFLSGSVHWTLPGGTYLIYRYQKNFGMSDHVLQIHGHENGLKRSRGFARPSIYAFCGTCCNSTVTKTGKNVAVGCFFKGVGYEKGLKRSHAFARPLIYGFCGRCCNSTVTKTGKNVAVGCFLKGAAILTFSQDSQKAPLMPSHF